MPMVLWLSIGAGRHFTKTNDALLMNSLLINCVSASCIISCGGPTYISIQHLLCRCTQRGRKTIKRYRGTCLLTFLLILLVDTCLLPKGKQAEQNGTIYLSILQRRAPPSRCWANAEREQTCSR